MKQVGLLLMPGGELLPLAARVSSFPIRFDHAGVEVRLPAGGGLRPFRDASSRDRELAPPVPDNGLAVAVHCGRGVHRAAGGAAPEESGVIPRLPGGAGANLGGQVGGAFYGRLREQRGGDLGANLRGALIGGLDLCGERVVLGLVASGTPVQSRQSLLPPRCLLLCA